MDTVVLINLIWPSIMLFKKRLTLTQKATKVSQRSRDYKACTWATGSPWFWTIRMKIIFLFLHTLVGLQPPLSSHSSPNNSASPPFPASYVPGIGSYCFLPRSTICPHIGLSRSKEGLLCSRLPWNLTGLPWRTRENCLQNYSGSSLQSTSSMLKYGGTRGH